jgi:hypothetical protein
MLGGADIHFVFLIYYRILFDNRVWDFGLVARRDNHINFYNRYLLLLEEKYTYKQTDRVCCNRLGVVGPGKGLTLRLGVPDECRQNSGHSRLVCRVFLVPAAG